MGIDKKKKLCTHVMYSLTVLTDINTVKQYNSEVHKVLSHVLTMCNMSSQVYIFLFLTQLMPKFDPFQLSHHFHCIRVNAYTKVGRNWMYKL